MGEYQKLAKNIADNIGGKENELWHLFKRFYL